MKRRDLLRCSLGALASLPFLSKGVGGRGTRSLKATIGRLKPLTMDVFLNARHEVAGTLHKLQLIHTPELQDSITDTARYPSTFGVVFYVDPRGIFMEADTDANLRI